jgi:hypothetical protein
VKRVNQILTESLCKCVDGCAKQLSEEAAQGLGAVKARRYNFCFPVTDPAGFSLAALSAFGAPLPEGAVSVEAISVFWFSLPSC